MSDMSWLRDLPGDLGEKMADVLGVQWPPPLPNAATAPSRPSRRRKTPRSAVSRGPTQLECLESRKLLTTVSFVNSTTNATEGGADGSFVLQRDNNGASESFTVVCNGYGANQASSGDYSVATSVNFPNGQSLATLTVHAIDDNIGEEIETLAATLAGVTGVATITSDEYPPSTVTFVNTTTNATEGDDDGSFVLQRSDTRGPETVPITLSGTGTYQASEEDYDVATSVSFATGASFGTLVIHAVNDGENEYTESLRAVISAGQTAVATITDDDYPPEVWITSSSPNAYENGSDAEFVIHRDNGGSGMTEMDIDVSISCNTPTSPSFSLSGALHDTSGSVHFTDIQTAATITLHRENNSYVQVSEYFTFSLSPASTMAGPPAYTLPDSGGRPATLSGEVLDDDLATLSVSATDDTASEDDRDPATFRITRDRTNIGSMDVYFTLSGSATAGDQETDDEDEDGIADDGSEADYLVTGAEYVGDGVYRASMGSSDSYVDVTVTPLNDAEVDYQEDITLTLFASSNGAYATPTDVFAVAVLDDVCAFRKYPTNNQKALVDAQIDIINDTNSTMQEKADAKIELYGLRTEDPTLEPYMLGKWEDAVTNNNQDLSAALDYALPNIIFQIIGPNRIGVTIRRLPPGVVQFGIAMPQFKPLASYKVFGDPAAVALLLPENESKVILVAPTVVCATVLEHFTVIAYDVEDNVVEAESYEQSFIFESLDPTLV